MTTAWTRRNRNDKAMLVTTLGVSRAQLVAGYSYDETPKLIACDKTQHSCNQAGEIAPNFWGIVVMLFSLTTAAWGFASSSELAWHLLLVFVSGPIMPVWSLIEVLGKAFVGTKLITELAWEVDTHHPHE